MSIYFVQVILALFGVSFFACLVCDKSRFYHTFVPASLGIIAGILIFKFAKYHLLEPQFRLLFDGLSLLGLAFCFAMIFFKFKFSLVFFALLGFAFGGGYSGASSLFPLFDGELLDSVSILSFFLMLFGFFILLLIFFSASALGLRLRQKGANKALNALALLSFLLLFAFKLSAFLLELMRAGLIKTEPSLLSLVAKGIYFANFAPYIFAFLILIFILLALRYNEKLPKKEQGIKEYRFALANRNFTLFRARLLGLLAALVLGFMLYFDLYASRPLVIDEPTYVEPSNGEFRFKASELADNKLHRYAYITDEGRVVRWFLLNRYEDRQTPVAVFDACSICGDVGYVKKGKELICVACNVRIFLPSVGQEGGCNPLPMAFSYDGEDVVISLDEIETGAGYFSQIVEKMLKDPVDGSVVSNQSPFSYRYKNRSFYFKNEDNLNKFEAQPEKYLRQHL